MQTLDKYRTYLLIVVAVIALGALAVFDRDTSTLHEPDAKVSQSTEQTAPQNKSSTPPTTTYTYTAQAGDSYSQIARKAVQTFGIERKLTLSQAQIVAAETFLTEAAGWPTLEISQKIVMQKIAVETAVSQVKTLSQEALAAWQTYVEDVDFDTKLVGESH